MRCLGTLALGLALVSCGDKGDLCSRSVKHMFDLMNKISDDNGAAPSGDEKAAMQVVNDAVLIQCREEGLTQAQADCIFGAKSYEQMMHLIECPAIAAKKPAWLRVPDAEMLRLMDERKKRQ